MSFPVNLFGNKVSQESSLPLRSLPFPISWKAGRTHASMRHLFSEPFSYKFVGATGGSPKKQDIGQSA